MNEKELTEKLMLTRDKVDAVTIVNFSDEAWEDVEKALAAQLDHALTTPITREKDCKHCKGRGKRETGVLKGGIFHGTLIDCLACNGTGKVAKTFTIKEAIEEKLK